MQSVKRNILLTPGPATTTADTREMRFTPPVQTFYALKKAIEALKHEGLQKCYERYVKSWQTLTDGIRRLGLTHIVNEDHHAKLVTAII